MKKKITHIILLFLLCAIQANAQELIGYSIDGDQVVFRFESKDYDWVSSENLGAKNIDDIKIDRMYVAGEFNNWSKNSWRLSKVSDGTYELRKNLSDFSDALSWEFKFVINEEYWVEPDDEIDNVVPANSRDGEPLHVFNLRMYTAFENPRGNASFKLRGFEDAKEVVICGSFNKWDENEFRLDRTKDGWSTTLQLMAGEYEYKFIIDGEWFTDPQNSVVEYDGSGNINSVIMVR